MSIEQASALDKKDTSCGMYKRKWLLGEKTTTRFDTFEQVIAAGIAKWRELGLDCPFISLYEGEKYSFKAGNTIILTPELLNKTKSD